MFFVTSVRGKRVFHSNSFSYLYSIPTNRRRSFLLRQYFAKINAYRQSRRLSRRLNAVINQLKPSRLYT